MKFVINIVLALYVAVGGYVAVTAIDCVAHPDRACVVVQQIKHIVK